MQSSTKNYQQTQKEIDVYNFWRIEKHWGFWIRAFGWHIAVSTMEPLFAERNGYRKCYMFGKIKVRVNKEK